MTVLYVHPELGRIWRPPALSRATSLPGSPTRRPRPGEFGVLIATQHRPLYDEWTGAVRRMQLIWHSIAHNERVDAGAAIQANRVFGTSGTTANGVFTAIAIASATLTLTKTDKSLGSASQSVTTNEFTTIGLARATGTVSTYTAPSSLGGAFSQLLTITMTATGSGTALGSGVFDSTTVAGSNLYVEANSGSSAVLVSSDTLTTQWTVSD